MGQKRHQLVFCMAKRRENKLSQLLRESLQTAPSVYYKKLNRWLLIPGRLSDDHRPLYTSHLTALLVTSVLRWIMQEMLWRIRHSGAEESCLSVWTCFRMKSETHLDASLAGKDKKKSGKNQKKKKCLVDFGFIGFPVHTSVCIMSELAKNILGYSQGIQ